MGTQQKAISQTIPKANSKAVSTTNGRTEPKVIFDRFYNIKYNPST